MTFESEQQVPAIPDDVDTTIGQAGAGKSRKSGEFVVAPLPSRNPLLGWTLTLPAMYLYRPPQVDDDDPAWITGAMALYSENDSKGAGLFHRMHLDKDRWRVLGAVFYADMNYEFFGIGGKNVGSPFAWIVVLGNVPVCCRDRSHAGRKACLYVASGVAHVYRAPRVDTRDIAGEQQWPRIRLPDRKRVAADGACAS